MSVQLNVGYLFAGDYFAGTTPEAIDVKNSYLIGLGTILVF